MVEMRLNAAERRQAILQAALTVFAEKGFDGTTTRDIAREAGVSEALLYRHFPSKEDLHSAIHDKLCSYKSMVLQYFSSQEPSTALLVQLHFSVIQLIAGEGVEPGSGDIVRLLVQDMLGEGKFARDFHEQRFYVLFPYYQQSLEVAIRAGDVVDSGMNERECLFFLHHVCVMAHLNSMPATPVFEYRKNYQALLEDLLHFSLRGIGMSPQAIAEHADLKRLQRGFALLVQKSSQAAE